MADGTIGAARVPDFEARGQIALLADMLTGDELDVLLDIARGLVAGRKAYGELRIAGDPRNWLAEAGQETRDLAVYLTIALRKAADSTRSAP